MSTSVDPAAPTVTPTSTSTNGETGPRHRHHRHRSRWAAIGAAVAVATGAGGLSLAGASGGHPAGVVTIEPVRILDTRSDIGLDGPFTSPVGRTLQVTGSVPTPDGPATVVPPGATGAVLNVTAVEPSADGFISVRPDGMPGAPTTSNLNFTAGSIIPNAVIVALSPEGAIEITFDAFAVAGPTADVLVDVTGYLVEMDAVEMAGPQGEPGPAGPPGAPGNDGAPGADAPRPANIVWVALDGGDFTNVQDALDSITDATADNPYVVKVAPGTYHGRVVLKDHVDIEGSGRDTTILTAPGGQGGADPASTVSAFGEIRAEVRHLTVANTGGGFFSIGISVDLSDGLRLRDLRVTATGATDINTAVSNYQSSLRMVDVHAQAAGEPTNRNEGVANFAGSSPTMIDVVAEASSGAGDHDNIGVRNVDSSPTMTGGSASASGPADRNYGVRNTGSSEPVLDQITATSNGAVSSNPGISSVGAGASPTVRNSVVNGSSASVSTITGASTQAVNTQLIGSVSGTNIDCLNSYDGNFTPLQANCQP